MIRVVVVCEGETEQEFVNAVLYPALFPLGIDLCTQTIETSPGHKGGALNYDRVKPHLRATLRQKNAPYVTTMFDLYKLDKRFPGYMQSSQKTQLADRLEVLCSHLHADVMKAAQCRPDRFIPYIQPYEFEALLFSDVNTLVQVNLGWHKARNALTTARDGAQTPEHINDRPETKPAAHLERELIQPRFRKREHGPLIAQKIGLTKIESECAYFSAWLTRIREIKRN